MSDMNSSVYLIYTPTNHCVGLFASNVNNRDYMEVPHQYIQSLGFECESDYMLTYPGCLHITSNSITKLLNEPTRLNMVKRKVTICPLIMIFDTVKLDLNDKNNKQSLYWEIVKRSTDIICSPTIEEIKDTYLNEFWFCLDWIGEGER